MKNLKPIFILILFFISTIFVYSQVWTQLGSDINGDYTDNYFGRHISFSANGQVIAIGTNLNDNNGTDSGLVKIYHKTGDFWSQIGEDITGDAAGDGLGASISLNEDGSIIAISAPLNDMGGNNAGQVKIFENIGGQWIQIGNDIIGSGTGLYQLGKSVSLNAEGSIIAVSASIVNNDEHSSNRVIIYQNLADEWIQIGENINSNIESAHTQSIVRINTEGTVVAIGDCYYGDSENHPGMVSVYQLNENTWTQMGESIYGDSPAAFLGARIDLNENGSIMVISSANNGCWDQVEIYQYEDNNWNLIGEEISQGNINPQYGSDVSLNSDGNIVAIGARNNNENGYGSGSVLFYHNIADEWVLFGNEIFGNPGEQFGFSVDLSANASRVVIGAPDAMNNKGLIRVYTIELSILEQPTHHINICVGQEIEFSVLATNVDSYQWQESNDDQNTWSDLSDENAYTGTITPNLNINTTLNMNNNYYRCILTNQTTEIYSNGAKLEFDSSPPVITSIPDDQFIEADEDCAISLPDYTEQILAEDNCDTEIIITQLPEPGTMLSDHANTITIIATDDFDNTTEASFNLEVMDHIAPIIHCANNQEVIANEFHNYVVVETEFDPVYTSDNCEILSLANNFNQEETLASAVFPEGTTYIIWTITDASGNAMNCSSMVQVNEYNGIDKLKEKGIIIYPNPVEEVLFLKFKHNKKKQIRILDIQGRKILQKNVISRQEYISVSTLKPGVYIIEIETNKEILTTKLIKKAHN